MDLILRDHKALLPYLIAMLGPFAVEVTAAFLALHLIRHYDCSQNAVGMVFSLSALMYVLGSIIGPLVFKNTPPKVLVSISCFISAIAMNITGPSVFLPLPHEFGLVLGGMLLMCLSANFFV